jgi:capsule polysaccharide export protein KpsE/RkpR
MASLNAYAALMAALSESISYQSESALNSTDLACNSTGNTTDNAVIAATTNVTDMFANFTAMVINNTVAYPNCTQYADMALTMVSQINEQIIQCGNQSDTAQSSIYANVTINIVAMAQEYNNFASKSDKCTRSFANSWLWIYIKWVFYRMGITSGIPNFLACQTAVCNETELILRN